MSEGFGDLPDVELFPSDVPTIIRELQAERDRLTAQNQDYNWALCSVAIRLKLFLSGAYDKSTLKHGLDEILRALDAEPADKP